MSGDIGDKPVTEISNLGEVTIAGLTPDGEVVQIPLSFFQTLIDSGGADEEGVMDGGSAAVVPDGDVEVDGGSA